MDNNVESRLSDLAESLRVNKIDLNTDHLVQSKRYPQYRKALSLIIIGILLCTTGVAAYCYTEGYFDNGMLSKSQQDVINNNRYEKMDYADTYSDIKVKVVAALNDGKYIMFQLKVFKNGKYMRDLDAMSTMATLQTENGEKYPVFACGGGTGGEDDPYTIKFNAPINHDETVKLSISNILNKNGEWKFEIPIKGQSVKVYNIDQIISTDGNKVTITKVETSLTNVNVILKSEKILNMDLFETKIFNDNEKGDAIDAASSNVDGECNSIIKFDKIALNENLKIEIYFSDGSKILDNINLNLNNQLD